MEREYLENQRNKKYKKGNRKKQKSKVKTILKVILIVILVLILIASGAAIGGYLYLRNGLLGSMNYVEIKKEDIEINS